MKETLKLVLTALGTLDAMAICLLDSYGPTGDAALAMCIITTVMIMPLYSYYMWRYHKKKKGL
mgnify:CR=1 FL=1|jgi:hypothetical protein